MKTVIFDFDGTLTLCPHGWKQIWQRLGYPTHNNSFYKALVSAHQNGEISFSEWQKFTEKAFRQKNLSRNIVTQVKENTELQKGTIELMKTLKQHGYKILIVSGGIEEIILSSFSENIKYIDQIYSIKLVYDKKDKFLKFDLSNYDFKGRKSVALEYCTNTRTNPNDIVFVGDLFRGDYSNLKTICLRHFDETFEENTNPLHKDIKTNNLISLFPLIEELCNKKDEYEKENF